MLRRSVPFLLAIAVPAAPFLGCGTDSSTFTPPKGDGSSSSSSSSGNGFDPGGKRDGGSSGTPAGPACGNTFLEEGEICDDGNTVSGDGCSADCQTVEAGFTCVSEGQICAAICGDAVKLGDEDCDDGNTTAGDGCSAGCRLEEGWKCPTVAAACERTTCGDGVQEGTEQCDDTQTGQADRPYDGCFQCVKEPSCAVGGCTGACGDGLLFPNEACDDGNTRDGDGCSSTCTIETGFDCQNTTEDPPAELALPVLYRDFKMPWFVAGSSAPVSQNEAMDPAGHPDFEHFTGVGTYSDLVKDTLGADKAPVFNKTTASANPCVVSDLAACGDRQQLTGESEFNEWYHDGPRGSLVLSTLHLPRQGSSDSYVFDSNQAPYMGYHFFPLDDGNPENTGTGWGTQTGLICRDPFSATAGNQIPVNCYGTAGSGATGTDSTPHNFGFTTELRFWFTYQQPASDAEAPVLEFTGDDDVWIFVNGHRVIDLGGLHSPVGASVQLTAAVTGSLGLTNNNVYEISLFHAERHSTASNFKFTLRGFVKTRTFCASKCGDGVKTKNETCDNGEANNDGAYGHCNSDCTWGPRCGDGVLQDGEQCDDGNFKDDDACKPDCTKPGGIH